MCSVQQVLNTHFNECRIVVPQSSSSRYLILHDSISDNHFAISLYPTEINSGNVDYINHTYIYYEIKNNLLHQRNIDNVFIRDMMTFPNVTTHDRGDYVNDIVNGNEFDIINKVDEFIFSMNDSYTVVIDGQHINTNVKTNCIYLVRLFRDIDLFKSYKWLPSVRKYERNINNLQFYDGIIRILSSLTLYFDIRNSLLRDELYKDLSKIGFHIPIYESLYKIKRRRYCHINFKLDEHDNFSFINSGEKIFSISIGERMDSRINIPTTVGLTIRNKLKELHGDV